MKAKIKDICSQCVLDVEQRIQWLDVQYLAGIYQKVYLSTVHALEPNTCATTQ